MYLEEKPSVLLFPLIDLYLLTAPHFPDLGRTREAGGGSGWGKLVEPTL